MTGLKFALIGALLGALSSVVGDTAAIIVGAAAAFAAGAYLYQHVVKPLVLFIARALTGYAVLEQLGDDDLIQAFKALPEWMVGVEQRLGGIEAKTAATNEPVQALARELDVHHRPPDPAGPPAI